MRRKAKTNGLNGNKTDWFEVFSIGGGIPEDYGARIIDSCEITVILRFRVQLRIATTVDDVVGEGKIEQLTTAR